MDIEPSSLDFLQINSLNHSFLSLGIAQIFRKHLEKSLEGFHSCCITSIERKVSVFMKDYYIASIPEEDKPFMTQFVDTQVCPQFD